MKKLFINFKERIFRIGRFHLYKEETVLMTKKEILEFRHGYWESAIAYRAWAWLGWRLLFYRKTITKYQ